ncbi:MAG: TonB-dependent receptor, partial [Candidatus Acidiferrales bacterium]
GSIGGTIYDTSGGIVPDAKLTLTSEYGTREGKAGSDGTYVFSSLEPGKYTLRVEYTNFKISEAKDISVRLNERTTVDVKLEAGAITQTITVTEASIGLDTSTTTSGGTITADLFKNAPVGRNIMDIPYLVAGVNDGLGTGRANPSISGATGLENLYIVNGINVGNAGYGSIGTYSTIFGPKGTGVQFDFVKEVQVKTSGFEAQYGQALGGVVNMITKSGGNTYHGGGYFFASPSALEATRLQPDAVRFNKGQQTFSESTWDAGGDFGGYLVKNRLFFYGGFNAIWNRSFDSAPANFRAISLGTVTVKTRNLNYSAKINYNLTANQNHQIEGSVFGDPSIQPFGANRQVAGRGFNGGSLQSDFPERSFSALDYGSRNWSVRYNGAITPRMLVNASFAWARNHFDENNIPNIYQVEDRTEATPGALNPVGDGLPTPGTSRGINQVGGAGFFENSLSNNKQYTVNSTLNFRAGGNHQFDYGFEYQDVGFDWFHRRSGPDWILPCKRFDGTAVTGIAAGDCGRTNFGAAMRLRVGGPAGYRFQQTRGAFTGQQGSTTTKYYALYIQDAWQMTKYLTLKLGLRWEQQRMIGEDSHYSFTGNWSPRAGIIVDPWGNRKTKIFANFGRFTEKIPQDLAVRSLSEERSYISNFFGITNPLSASPAFNSATSPTAGCPASTPATLAGLQSCLHNPANWILDQAHNITGTPIFSGGITAFAPGTKSQYQDEYVVGIEHEFRGGIFVSARYLDRRLRRIVEDISGQTVGASISGVAFDGSDILQNFVLSNPGATTDVFRNTLCHDRTENPFNENAAGEGCLVSGYEIGSGALGPDGLPDGYPTPIRKYQAFEFQFEKRFTKNWQLIGNWRISKLFGNYEGLFRNDNAQDDPNITSLFDFVASSSLGDQFTPGVLPTDRRDIVNVYSSYLFNNGFNIGGGLRFQTGYPLDKLGAHPAYLNQGEIPLGGRGSQGRSQATAGINAQVNYTWKMTERYRVKLGASMFNIVNSRRVVRVDRNNDTGFLSGVSPPIQQNPDFLKPTAARDAYQRPFSARLSVRLEF